MDGTKVAREVLFVAKELLAIDFPTQDAMDKYLKEHPDADKSNHRVVEKKKTQETKKKPEPEKKTETERVPTPKFEDIKPRSVSDSDKKELEDVNYKKAVEMLKGGERGEKRLREILNEAKKRPDEIKTTLKQWESYETMPKSIVDGFEEELGKLQHQIRGVERALEENKKSTKTGGSMNGRDRLTARDSHGIVAEIDELERLIKADDDSDKPEDAAEEAIEDAAEEAIGDAAEEVEEVGQSEEKDGGGQNARAMKNWPMTASERCALARRLVAMARRLMA